MHMKGTIDVACSLASYIGKEITFLARTYVL